MGEGGGKDRRRAVACADAILREERGMLIGGIKVGRYGKITHAALARAYGLKGGLTEVTCQVEKIRVNNDTLADTLALTEEEVRKIFIMKVGWIRWDH